MALADGVLAPQSPTIYAIYRGFYILPTDILPTSVVRIDFFVSRSSDDLTWENWQLFTYGNNSVGMYGVHAGLDENTYYAYYCQYVYSDGSKSPVGQIGNAGQAQLTISSNLNIDQLASRAYSTGLITSGIFQGVVFRTAALDPKVQMDPTGIWADDASGNNIFYIHADGSTAFFSGQIDLNEGTGYLAPPPSGGQGSEISWGGPFTGAYSINHGAGTGADNAGVGTVAWSSPNNVNQNNESNPTTATLTQSDVSHYLLATNYNFGSVIPPTATITGITVRIDRVNNGLGFSPLCHDNRVRLIKGGSIQSTDKASAADWPTSFAQATYGASNDLWSGTWTPSDINNSGFGVALSVVDTSSLPGSSSTAQVASIQITINYTNPALSVNSSWIQGVAISGHHQLAVGASGTGVSRKLIQDDGTSDFLQNANNLSELANKSTARNNLGFKWGAAQITVGANTTFTIQHNLGVAPAFFIGFPAGWTGFLITPGGTDATNMTFQASVALSNNFVTWFAFA